MKSIDEVFLMCPGHIHKNGQILSNSVNFLKWKTTNLSTNIGKWLFQKKIKAHYTHTKETGIKFQSGGGSTTMEVGEIRQNQGGGIEVTLGENKASWT